MAQIVRVESSVIESVVYDRIKKELYVKFLNGGLYRYLEYPPEAYDVFMRSESKGSHFASAVKGKYPSQKVDRYPDGLVSDAGPTGSQEDWKSRTAAEKTRFAELLQAQILVRGGRRFSVEELLDMRIGDVIDTFSPNGISIRSDIISGKF